MEGKNLQLYNIFCVDYRSKSVKKYQWSKFFLKLFFLFLRKKLYALVWIPLKTRTNFNKTKIFKKYFT